MRPIDADALIELIPKTSQSKFENCWTCKLLSAESVKEIINSAPTIETKKIKYFDEDESVWKIGRVIVDE